MMNDGHNTTLDFASSWAHTFLKPLLADGAFKERTLILLTYDESATYEIPNKIGSLLLGNAVPSALRGTEDDTYYTHYSIPATMEYNWQLPNLGRYDIGANVFKNSIVTADTTAGHQNKGDPDNLAGIDNSLSYPGFLNSDPAKWRPIPPPNLRLVGAGGLPVSDAVYNQWWQAGDEESPYDGSGRAFDGDVYLPQYGKQEPNGVLPT